MIDVKIKDGDVVTDSTGCPVYAEGADALFRRAVLRLTPPRGSFIYNRELGTEQCGEDRAHTELLFAEALAGYADTQVRVLQIGDGVVSVQLTIDGESRVEEVRRYGDV